MLPQLESRVGIAIALLALQTFVFGLEILFAFGPTLLKDRIGKWRGARPAQQTPSTKPRFLDWSTIVRHLIAPLSVGLLGVILVPILFSGKSKEFDRLNDACEANFDADICGDGVRISIWVQVGVLILISILGTFHPEKSGAKEVGAGLVVTHVSLVIALLVQLRRNTLSPVDAIVGSMIIDAQNVALSLQLASKETLAARWQVGIVLVSQCFSLAVIPLLVVEFLRGQFVTGDCPCLTVFWWAWISNCSDQQPAAGSPREFTAFWVYYAFRLALFVQCSFHTLLNTVIFHRAEIEVESTLEGITFPDPIYPPGWGNKVISYQDYPSTAALMYTVHAVFAMTSLATAEITIRDFNLRPSSQVFAIGQIIAIVVAGATVGRALWLFLGMFVPDLKLPWLPTRKVRRPPRSKPKPSQGDAGGEFKFSRARTNHWNTKYFDIQYKNPFKASWTRIRGLYLLPPDDLQAPVVMKLGNLQATTQIAARCCISGCMDPRSRIPAVFMVFDVNISFNIQPHQENGDDLRGICSMATITLKFSETGGSRAAAILPPTVEAFAPYPGSSTTLITPDSDDSVTISKKEFEDYFKVHEAVRQPAEGNSQALQVMKWRLRYDDVPGGPSSFLPSGRILREPTCSLAVLVSRDTKVEQTPADELAVEFDMEFVISTKDIMARRKDEELTCRVYKDASSVLVEPIDDDMVRFGKISVRRDHLGDLKDGHYLKMSRRDRGPAQDRSGSLFSNRMLGDDRMEIEELRV